MKINFFSFYLNFICKYVENALCYTVYHYERTERDDRAPYWPTEIINTIFTRLIFVYQ